MCVLIPRQSTTKERIAAIINRMREKREREQMLRDLHPQPRYDEIFYEGVKWLDENG